MFILIFFTSLSFSKVLIIKNAKTNILQDTTKFYYQEKFERIVKLFTKDKTLNFKKEEIYGDDILDTEEKALTFAKFIISVKLPKVDPNWPKEYTISQDKTSKLWFINCRFLKAAIGGDVHMIILKNNCKLLYYFKTS